MLDKSKSSVQDTKSTQNRTSVLTTELNKRVHKQCTYSVSVYPYHSIPMSTIKESIQIISEPLAHIINLSIAHGIVPDQMKIVRVVALFKAEDPSLFTNYKPVSILPSFSKFLERIIYNRILDCLTNLHILCDNQFGFRRKSLYHACFD